MTQSRLVRQVGCCAGLGCIPKAWVYTYYSLHFSGYLFSSSSYEERKKKRGTDSLNQVTSNFKVARFKSFFLVRDMKFQSGSQCPWAAQWFRVISLSHSLQVCQTLTAWVQFSGCLGKADSFQITASHPEKLLSLGNFYPGANWAQTYKYLWNRAGTQPKVILLQYAPADLLQPHPTTGVLDVFSALFLLQVCV